MANTINLEFNVNDWYCFDGCCYDWIEEIYANGNLIYAGEGVTDSVDIAISAFNYVGYDVVYDGHLYSAKMDLEDD